MIHPRLRPVAVLLCCLISACSSAATSPGHPSATRTPASRSSAPAERDDTSGTVHVAIRNFRFEPAEFTLRPGDTVTVTNQDSTTHTLTATDKSFDTGAILPGASATFTAPQQPGAHPYTCTIHPFMQGTLTVT
ncbi:cupredoxin family copper-binding protein [Kitasatospora sp. NPDC089797]|uniref:cupredoxin domain-containing protein n=1 Tax=Kitasatospora sp. NPDC089797 TaxID=3155298 RepID=UPI003423C10E